MTQVLAPQCDDTSCLSVWPPLNACSCKMCPTCFCCIESELGSNTCSRQQAIDSRRYCMLSFVVYTTVSKEVILDFCLQSQDCQVASLSKRANLNHCVVLEPFVSTLLCRKCGTSSFYLFVQHALLTCVHPSCLFYHPLMSIQHTQYAHVVLLYF